MATAFSFTAAQMVDIRRFTGYGAVGVSLGSYHFFSRNGRLEFLINNMTQEEGAVVVTFLTNCNSLEAAVYAASANLDTDQAAVWHHNKSEVRDRKRLFNECRVALCDMIGIPPGPSLGGSGMVLVA